VPSLLRAATVNFALITLDSVRFDQYLTARTPFLDSIGTVHRAKAHADSTFPSHMGLLHGCLHLPEGYNRKAYTFAPWMPSVLKDKGYNTIAAVSMPWIHKKAFGRGFDHFFEHPFGEKGPMAPLETLLPKASDCLAPGKNFLFLNIGETHFPYSITCQDMFWDGMLFSLVNDPASVPLEVAEDMKRDQVKAIEWVDRTLDNFFSVYADDPEYDWLFYVTADHGELFGEHGLWLHGHGCFPEEIDVPVVCNDLDKLLRMGQ
jgi:hypothetical protein